MVARPFTACSLLAALLVFCAVGGPAQGQPTADRQASLKTFLQDYVKDPHYDYKATRFIAAFVDLRDDGARQVIVYFTDLHFCGSGGCKTLILEPDGGSYTIVTSMTITRPPICILKTKSNGWHDISVFVAGGFTIR